MNKVQLLSIFLQFLSLNTIADNFNDAIKYGCFRIADIKNSTDRVFRCSENNSKRKRIASKPYISQKGKPRIMAKSFMIVSETQISLKIN